MRPLWTAYSIALVASSLSTGAEGSEVAVAVVGSSAPSEAISLRTAVRAALARQPLLELASEESEARWFQGSGPPEPGSALETAEKWIRRAQKAFREFRLDDAMKSVRKADAAVEPWRGHPDARDLDRAHLVLAVSIAHAQRDEPGLEEGLAAYARRFGHEGAPPESGWPPDLSERLTALTRFGQEVLHVLSTPSAAVFVDGRRVGVTPLTLADLEPGPHRVVVRADGFYSADVPVHVDPSKPATLELQLSPRLAEQLASAAPAGPIPAPLREAIQTSLSSLDDVVLASKSSNGFVLRRLKLRDEAPAEHREVTLSALDDGALDDAVDSLFAELLAGPSRADRPLDVPTWAYVSGGLGLTAVVIGTALRLSAASDQSDLATGLASLSQAEAYGAREDAASKAEAGTVFIGAGATVLVGTATYLLFDWLGGGDP